LGRAQCGSAGRSPSRWWAVLVGGPLGGHGGDFFGGGLPCFLTDQVGQTWNLAQPADSVLQIVPKTQAQLAAGFLQTGKCVAATTPRVAARTATDLTAFDKFSDIRFPPVVVQRDFRPSQHT